MGKVGRGSVKRQPWIEAMEPAIICYLSLSSHFQQASLSTQQVKPPVLPHTWRHSYRKRPLGGARRSDQTAAVVVLVWEEGVRR